MKDQLELFLLEEAKGYLKSLSKEDFLALTCDIVALITGLVRLVRNESAARNINATDNTAKTFRRSKRHKRTAEKLEKAHPDSESIKYGFTIAIMK